MAYSSPSCWYPKWYSPIWQCWWGMQPPYLWRVSMISEVCCHICVIISITFRCCSLLRDCYCESDIMVIWEFLKVLLLASISDSWYHYWCHLSPSLLMPFLTPWRITSMTWYHSQCWHCDKQYCWCHFQHHCGYRYQCRSLQLSWIKLVHIVILTWQSPDFADVSCHCLR